MKILILGGDKRYHQIIDNLSKKYEITLVGYHTHFENCTYKKIEDINISLYDCIIFPVNGIQTDYIINAEEDFKVPNNLLEKTKENVIIFSGINTPLLKEVLMDRKCILLMKDDEIIKENAIPTVEGIISNLIGNTDITISGANIMVIGYGNIGKYLISILKDMGANVVVSIIDEKDKAILDKTNINNCYSYDYLSMKSYLNKMDMVINTAPTLVINKDFINSLNQDIYILDVSSYPHGIDKESLDKRKIKNNIYLGIPSKVAPKTSGLILTKKIDKILGGKE